MADSLPQTHDYLNWLKDLKLRVRQAQLKAAVQVNTALLTFYWELGTEIVERQKNAAWGSGFLQQLSRDLMAEFPDMKGFSLNNLQYIRRWYLFHYKGLANCGAACSTIESATGPANVAQAAPQLQRPQIVDRLVQIPWGHNQVIISKCSDTTEALYYVEKTIEQNWSRGVLVHQIESGLYARSGKAVTNFTETLTAPQSDLAQQLIKDPYCFDFLTITEDYNERDSKANGCHRVSADTRLAREFTIQFAIH